MASNGQTNLALNLDEVTKHINFDKNVKIYDLKNNPTEGYRNGSAKRRKSNGCNRVNQTTASTCFTLLGRWRSTVASFLSFRISGKWPKITFKISISYTSHTAAVLVCVFMRVFGSRSLDVLFFPPKYKGFRLQRQFRNSKVFHPFPFFSQHYLMMFGGTISVPFILTPALCIEENDPVRSAIVSTIIFVSGIITLLQCTIGIRYAIRSFSSWIKSLSNVFRLPIVQGGTFAFLVPTFAILNLPEWSCPAPEVMANMTYEDKTELWQLRMREVQGAIVVASVFQLAIGVFGIVWILWLSSCGILRIFYEGIVGLILRFITPLTIAPAIVMVGLSLFGAAGNMAGKHWGISAL